ncbi:hypothetical protein RG47T_0774 [Mucilaginibacter polytrichastri]|uniref:Uncharacterized protein n=1 Tax=Mucilaginibacter polytrichastri TaxID=1302689 RepID=A0A1Q5ZU86_9SPHI|nr:hypothetical protein RG47T_0774 [Mucilaginibacter polytrichastri]
MGLINEYMLQMYPFLLSAFELKKQYLPLIHGYIDDSSPPSNY